MYKKKDLYLRDVTEKDIELLFEWANDNSVRKNAFHMEKISYKEHEVWFHKLLSDKKQAQFIMMDKNQPVGQIRLSFDGEIAEIDYSIDLNKRGMGYGKAICKMIIQKLKKEFPNIKKLVAKVKTSNAVSRKCLGENGFKEIYRQYELDIGD